MRYWKSSRSIRTRLQLCAVLVLLTLLMMAPVWADERVTVRSVVTEFDGERYRLSANIEYQLSQVTREALHKGVPVEFQVEIEIERSRSFWLDENIASLRLHYELSYRPLSRKYLVINENSGALLDFDHYDAAIGQLGVIANVPLADRRLIAGDSTYTARLRAMVDRSHLPFALRMWSRVWPSWGLESEWFQWILKE